MTTTPTRRVRHATMIVALIGLAISACGTAADPQPVPDPRPADDAAGTATPAGPLTVYSGRSEELVGEVLDGFTAATGIELRVRYGNTAELAATIFEEGDASPADVYFAQDAGALGALEADDRFVSVPDELLALVDETFRAPSGAWIGITGRARVIAYNTDVLDADDVPASVHELTDPQWRGRIGWAPENGSFQAFVTAMRIHEGEDVAREWLEAIVANDPVVFPNNTGAVEGVARGEADVALVNHYYLHRFLAEDPAFTVANAYLPGDIGGLINVAGIGVLATSDQQEAAFELIAHLLREDVQAYFGQVTDAPEFPLRAGVDAPELPSLESLDPPAVDLSRLEDLQGTLELLREVGVFA